MRILLATDGSEFAEAGADLLSKIPLPPEVRVSVLTVIPDIGLPDSPEEQAGAVANLHRSLKQEAERTLVSAVRRLRRREWVVDVEIREGHVSEQILDCAGDLRADLVVVGSRGMGSLERYLLGSVSHRVMRHCDCSVLIVRPDEPDQESDRRLFRILAAFDGSETSWKALRSLAALPMQDRARVRLIRVMTLVKAYRMDILQKMTPVFREQERAAQAGLSEASDLLAQSGAEVEAKLLEGEDAADLIVEAAAEFGADLIVLGDKGEGAIERFLLGSITSKVAHHAPCSVLIVKGAKGLGL